MNNNLVVKEITLQDLDEFFEVFSKVVLAELSEYSSKTRSHIISSEKYWNKDKFRKIIQNNLQILLGAWINDQLVGILNADHQFGGVSICIWILIDPAFQRKGIGRSLLFELEKIMKENGAHLLYLYCDKRNVPFYEKIGFKQSGMFEKSWFGSTDYIMSKILQEPKEENFLK